MTKHSRQRDAVYQELCLRKDHPTANELYFAIKEKIPSISLATVYRNLTQLEADGKILRITGGLSDRFDGDITPHSHFVCLSCGRVIDICVKKEGKDEIEDFGGIITGKTVTYSGYCPECSKNFA